MLYMMCDIYSIDQSSMHFFVKQILNSYGFRLFLILKSRYSLNLFYTFNRDNIVFCYYHVFPSDFFNPFFKFIYLLFTSVGI